MTLFNVLTAEVQELIKDYPEIINEMLPTWIKAEIKIRNGIAVEVCKMLTEAKRMKKPNHLPINANPKRSEVINKLCRLGNGIEQFRGVINYMVEKWWGTEFQHYLTPETLFRESNFQKYLEEARENYKPSDKKKVIKNQYEELINQK